MNLENLKLTNSSELEFKIVEVSTEMPTEAQTDITNSMKKLWTWGQSKYNSTPVVEKVSLNKTNNKSKNISN